MSKSLRRFEILLPLRFNDGQAVPDDLIADGWEMGRATVVLEGVLFGPGSIPGNTRGTLTRSASEGSGYPRLRFGLGWSTNRAHSITQTVAPFNQASFCRQSISVTALPTPIFGLRPLIDGHGLKRHLGVMVMSAITREWKYLERRPGSSYQQLSITQKRIWTWTLYCEHVNRNDARTADELAADWGIPAEAVQEAIALCQQNVWAPQPEAL